jgi:hypothetical protein
MMDPEMADSKSGGVIMQKLVVYAREELWIKALISDHRFY